MPIPKLPNFPNEKKYRDWVQACIDNSDNLNEWEENFISEIGMQDAPITENQAVILERIYASKTR